MSAKSKLIHDIYITADRIGGAVSTRVARKRHGKKFAEWYCKHALRPASSLGEIDLELLPQFVSHLRAVVEIGTLHNYLASIRRLLRAAKVDLTNFENNCALGAGARDRRGRKEPFPDELWEDLLMRAKRLDEGLYHVLRIERLLGCRGLEALMSTEDIKRWTEELEYFASIKIGRGTKGGRSRITEIIVARVDETREALADALAFLENHDYFVEGCRKGLNSARSRYHRLARKLGLIGKWSPHSLRYAWACEKILELLDAGWTRGDILSFVSIGLGHGSGRGRWAVMIYGQSVRHLLPSPTKKAEELFQFALALRRQCQDSLS